MATNNVTISGTNVTVTVDGTVVFPTSGSGPKPPEPTRAAIGSNSGIMWGTNAHPCQGGTPYASMPLADQFSLMKGMGLTDYRLDFYEADDTQMGMLQQVLDEAARQGIGVLPIIIPNFQGYPNENAAYEDAKTLARTYASRFKQVKVWELGNEYELWAGVQLKGQGIYITDYDYNQYVLARGAYRGMLDGMREGNPNALGCIDTSGHGHWGWTDELWKDDVRWDITGEHFYSATFQDGTPVDIRDLHLECGRTDKLQLLKDHYNLPIFLTEFNYNVTTDGQKQEMADYLAMAMPQYDGFAKEYGLERVHLYELLDQPHLAPDQSNFGKCTDGTHNVAGEVVKAYLAAHPSVVYA